MPQPPPTTNDAAYTERLRRSERGWRRWLDVQAPYRWNLRRLEPGRVLDVGCGVGRNLAHVGGKGVGVDPNAASVSAARERGLVAFTPGEFRRSEHARAEFDTLLFAHVLEHMSRAEAADLVREYTPFLRPEGRVVLITPQEAGFRTDATHVEFLDFGALRDVLAENAFEASRSYSFPFPRFAGRWFPHNEFVVVGSSLPGTARQGPGG